MQNSQIKQLQIALQRLGRARTRLRLAAPGRGRGRRGVERRILLRLQSLRRTKDGGRLLLPRTVAAGGQLLLPRTMAGGERLLLPKTMAGGGRSRCRGREVRHDVAEGVPLDPPNPPRAKNGVNSHRRGMGERHRRRGERQAGRGRIPQMPPNSKTARVGAIWRRHKKPRDGGMARHKF
jgi:hypothetical protein